MNADFDFLVEFGNRLKAARKEKGFKNRKEIGKFLGVHPNSYGLYEIGKRSPNALLIKKFGDLLGIDFNWLFTGESSVETIEQDLLTNILFEVDRYVQEECLILTCYERAKIISILYEDCAEKKLHKYRMTHYQKSMIKMVAEPQETNKNE